MSEQKPLQIIVLGAHPDDCEGYFGGTAALFAQLGHEVTFVNLTKGDAGHHLLKGEELSRIRAAESEASQAILGIARYETLDNHDGQLMPSLALRQDIVRLIRNYGADLVFTHRPYDYHPDHRYGGITVQDAAYLVMVPNICPDTPVLRRNPVFLHLQDNFRKPYPFEPDIAIGIDDVWETKLAAMAAHRSQFGEWLPWVDGYASELPADPEAAAKIAAQRYLFPAEGPVRETLRQLYGEASESVVHAEAFEICEYGRQPSPEEIRRLFPMLPKPSK